MRNRSHASRYQQGFSLLELSIVVAILSVVSVAGLEGAVQFIGQRNYDATQQQLTKVDTAIDNFYKSNGRLPCPAALGLNPALSTSYGKEDCVGTVFGGTGAGVMGGALPFRTLNLAQSMSLDPWGNKLGYFVTQNLTNYNETDSASSTPNGSIVVRSGNFSSWTALTTSGAYVVLSHGADKRGAFSKLGINLGNCGTSDTRIDAQNCVYTAGGSTNPTINANVFYDSRFNNGNIAVNYFDDVVIWRARGQL